MKVNMKNEKTGEIKKLKLVLAGRYFFSLGCLDCRYF